MFLSQNVTPHFFKTSNPLNEFLPQLATSLASVNHAASYLYLSQKVTPRFSKINNPLNEFFHSWAFNDTTSLARVNCAAAYF